MYGTIIFKNEIELAIFLKHFAGSTACFTVDPLAHGGYKLTFTGGY